MRNFVITVAVTGALASSAFAEDVLPTDVRYEDGAVSVSLSGVAGDAANGRKIVGDKKQGNCVACHSVTELKETVPFHGEIGPMLDGAEIVGLKVSCVGSLLTLRLCLMRA